MPESNREEIAKLEALYASNPDGRVFTHLAEAYRKAGEYDRARTILDQGLAKHPAYASAHVVLGRVFMDLNSPDEAFESFRRVLNLDPHNLVALRSLGDLARAAGRNVEAIGFYEELRHQDPSNEELEGIIAELLAAPEPASASALEPEPVPPQPAFEAASEPEPAVSEAPEPAPASEAEAEPVMPDFAESPDFGEMTPGEIDLGWADDESSEEPLPGDLANFAGLSASANDGQEGFGDIDLSFGDEAPEAAAEEPPALLDLGAFEEPLPHTPPAAEPAPPSADGAWAAEPPAPSGEVVTETMAELYRNQGLYDRAAEVYRNLLEQRPGNEALQAKLSEVEAMARGGALPAPEIEPEPLSFEGTPEELPSFVSEAPESIAEALPASELGGWEPEPEPAWQSESVQEPEPEPEPVPAWEPEPERMFDEVEVDTEPEVESVWTSGAVAEDVPTPYAWTEAAPIEKDETGSAVSAYFQSLLAWRPAKSVTEAAPETEAEPEILELDTPLDTAAEPMFEELPAQPEPEPEPEPATAEAVLDMPWEEPAAPVLEPPAAAAPAVPAAAPAMPRATSPSDSPVDDAFDEWFGDPEPAAPAAQTPAAEQASAEDASVEGEDDDDLEMFRSWLQSLKK